jgi:hypothetical protein
VGERKAEEESDAGRVADARVVALEWASEVSVWAESSNAHEAMEAGVRLKELLKREK